MTKLGGSMHCTKISTEFEFGGHGPLGAHPLLPKNVAVSYDDGKISAGCLFGEYDDIMMILHIIVIEQTVRDPVTYAHSLSLTQTEFIVQLYKSYNQYYNRTDFTDFWLFLFSFAQRFSF